MSLTTITINTVAYQSYASVTEADEYLAVEPARFAAWTALAADAKGRNLVAATRRLDELSWAGEKADSTQTTEWPRSGLEDRDGNAQDSTTVPDRIERAAILLAGDLAVDPAALSVDYAESDVQSERIGPKAVTYFHRRRSRLERAVGNGTVIDLISLWLAGETVRAPVATGTDVASTFKTPNPYGRTRGL